MTTRQKVLKFAYPLLAKFNTLTSGKKGIWSNPNGPSPYQSFYALQATLNDGTVFPFSRLEGKKVLLVNLASDCGYTPQYTELQELQDTNADRLIVLGFPANDFKGQEPGTDEEIGAFCQKNYAISFPLFRKHSVLRPGQNSVFKWLSHKELNGWNDQQPSWNFCKYLVSESGHLQHYFPTAVSPLGKVISSAINA